MSSLSRHSGISSDMLQVMNDDREIQMMIDWRESDGALLSPVFAVKTDYDKQRAEWRVTTSTKLSEVAKMLASRHSEDNESAGPHPEGDVSWLQVLNIMENAEKTYAKKAEDNRVRGWIRGGGVLAAILGRLTELIPEQDGLSILRGGLAFIFESWRLRIANVQAVLLEFHEVPGVLANMIETCDACSDNANLKNLVVEYYKRVVDELPGLVAILLRISTRSKNVIRKLIDLLPAVEADQIDRTTKRLQAAKKDVDERIAHIDRHTWHTTKKAAVKTQASAEASRKTLFDVKADVAEFRQENRSQYDQLSSKVAELEKKGSGWVDRQEVAITKMQEYFGQQLQAFSGALATQVHNAFSQLTADRGPQQRLVFQAPLMITHPKQGLINNAIPFLPNTPFLALALQPSQQTQPPQQEQNPPGPSSFTLQDMIHRLRVPDPTTDGLEILSKNSQLSDQAISYINALGAKPHFLDWLASPSPRLLLVDGHSRDAGVGRTASPMSFFTASLAASLIRDGQGVTLQFFCGRHADPETDADTDASLAMSSGPNALLRSLIAQLALHPSSGIPPPGPAIDAYLASQALQNDTNALCVLFETLFWHVPRGVTVYMLLDSISDFETDAHGFWAELERVFDMFRSLMDISVNTDGPGPTLKVLMTTPNRSHRLFRRVGREGEHIMLHARDGDGGRLRVENRFWTEQSRRRRSPSPFPLE